MIIKICFIVLLVAVGAMAVLIFSDKIRETKSYKDRAFLALVIAIMLGVVAVEIVTLVVGPEILSASMGHSVIN